MRDTFADGESPATGRKVGNPATSSAPATDIAAVIDETEQIEAPAQSDVIGSEKVSHEDKTRRYLAVGAMALLAVLAIGGLLGWLFGDRSTQEIQSFAVIFSPVIALLGPILGFYFSKAQK